MGRKHRGEYPADWPAIAKGVKDAAGWRCVRCGHPHEMPGARLACSPRCDMARHPEYRPARRHETSGILAPEFVWTKDGQFVRRAGHAGRPRQRVLTVAHLDDNKANCRWWNLAALCQVCHLVTQARIELQRPWVLPHSAWFKPYVAGYYAQRYLGLDLTRDQVEARLDELLELERDALLQRGVTP